MALTYDFAGTGVLSGDWVEEVGGAGAVERFSGVARNGIDWSSVKFIYIWGSDSSPLVGFSKITYNAQANKSRYGGVARFTKDGSGNGYSATINTASNFGEIIRWDTGSETQLEYVGSITPADGDIIEIDCNSSDVMRLKQNGVAKGSGATDTTYKPATPYAGFLYIASGGIASSNSTIDDWEATAAAGGADVRNHIIPAYMRMN